MYVIMHELIFFSHTFLVFFIILFYIFFFLIFIIGILNIISIHYYCYKKKANDEK